ncbi:amidase domain-containing protein [Mycobacterium sp. 236(2023)]|uniref:amidase domain-containing protein n=1 Tax=Mycobacterium sp. 236(2023) TaxID=3038163 RepID=UPI002414E709|nr:amidase domain-containing protein [Mycobacterium sp. 236(2023)]MDG4663715.1 amidase domain-containing protein [Mycobacterium sp. 236(2023)]
MDLRSASLLHDDTCDEIHANGVRALEDNWADAVGDLAKGELTKLADKFRVMGVLDSGAASAMDTLDDAILVAQREVNDAVYAAESKGLEVSADGRVSLPSDTTGHDVELLEWHRDNAQRMIDDAVEAATQADEAGRAAIEGLKVDPDTTTSARALELQADAVHDALSMMRNQLPDGLSPEQQTAWWNSLTPEMQEDFKKAVPLDLYNLPGLPASVKTELEARDRGYNAMETLQYARDQWDDTGSDIFPNNCAHFVSQALHAGGLPYKGSSTMDENGWGRSAAGEWEWDMPDKDYWPEVEGFTHSRSWYNADSQQGFLLNNGGESVGIANARPGDVVYFDYADGPGGNVDGEAHHAAVVTAVLPDGEVLYTQHTAGAENSTLTGRLPMVAQDEGAQTVTVVRPKQTW